MTRAVVFAYHDVGVRCLSVLLARGLDVALVLTHDDNPREQIWFGSVARLAALHRLPVTTVTDPNAQDMVARVRALQPDFVFSFYYRAMLEPALLEIPPRGALNLHGSLLPRYRGRVPVNWAVINGETETGATLHYMAAKPDAGDIVDQQAVPILPDDTALDVFRKVTCAAELVLHRSLPGLIAGAAPRRAQNLAAGSYFGGRRPEDGVIRWGQPAQAVHNLVRGVAPPYPGALTELDGRPARILRTLREPGRPAPPGGPAMYAADGEIFAACGDGAVLRVAELEVEGQACDPARFRALFDGRTIALAA
jgi:methionyl-tRNA formyltransferase